MWWIFAAIAAASKNDSERERIGEGLGWSLLLIIVAMFFCFYICVPLAEICLAFQYMGGEIPDGQWAIGVTWIFLAIYLLVGLFILFKNLSATKLGKVKSGIIIAGIALIVVILAVLSLWFIEKNPIISGTLDVVLTIIVTAIPLVAIYRVMFVD